MSDGCVTPPVSAGSHIFFMNIRGFVEPLKNAHVLACTLGYTTFETAQALLSNMICGFKTRFVSISQRLFKLFCCLIKIQLYIGAYKS
jgi:hypothetical protein